jgi:hypothetical protein
MTLIEHCISELADRGIRRALDIPQADHRTLVSMLISSGRLDLVIDPRQLGQFAAVVTAHAQGGFEAVQRLELMERYVDALSRKAMDVLDEMLGDEWFERERRMRA